VCLRHRQDDEKEPQSKSEAQFTLARLQASRQALICLVQVRLAPDHVVGEDLLHWFGPERFSTGVVPHPRQQTAAGLCG
jgi:hypothetical protein